MANYSVDIQIAVKGQKEIQKTRVETRLLQRSIDRLNKTVEKDSRKVVKSFDNFSKEVTRAKHAVNSAAIGTNDFHKAIKNLVKVETAHDEIKKKKIRTIAAEKLSIKQGISLSEAKTRVLLKEAQAEKELNRSKRLNLNLGRGIGGAVGSGIIGGGFPLLFGQGPIAAAGGAIGGIAGGALSAIPGMGQFGFALSIAGTAIGSAMEDLTQALRKPEENIDNLISKLGLVGTPTEEMAQELERLGLKSSAAKLVMDKFNERFGDSPDAIRENTEKMIEFKNKVNELGTAITLFLGKSLIPFIDEITNAMSQGNLLKALKAQEGKNFSKAQQSIVNQSNKEADRIFKTTNRGKDIGKTRSQIFDERLTFNLKKAVGSPDATPSLLTGVPEGGTSPKDPNQSLIDQTKFDQQILPLQQALELEKKRFSLSSQQLNALKEENKLTNLNKKLRLEKLQLKEDPDNVQLRDKVEILKTEVSLQKQILENAQTLADPIKAQTIQLDQQMRVLMDRGSQIVALSQTISQSFERSFMGIINGTMSVNDAFRNMLGSIANHFTQTAAKMMANQLQRGLLGLLGNTLLGSFGGGSEDVFAGFNRGPAGDTSLLDFSGRGFARGGRPPVGKASIVGERGPELFVPSTAGTIVPNNAMAGTTNIIINVDASSSSSDGQQGQANDIGNALAAAIQTELINQKRPGGLLSNA